MVITLEIYKDIRRMRLGGMSQRQIAGALHISRNTVKKYWDGNSVPWERKDYSREATVITDDVISFVKRCLDEDAHCRSKKQHHTAKRIYDRLVEEYGFTGGETTVRRLVHQLREKTREAFVPLAFPAGDAMQIDWGEATVYLKGIRTTVNLFCARMCYSDAPIVLAYRRQNEESFLDALVCVFQYFGGVPKRVIFDNGKVAVKDGFGAHAKKQAGYRSLSAHYGFEAVFCNPASGNEKGLVEGLVGYIRRNVCVPVPRVGSMEELNVALEAKCSNYLSHHVRGKDAYTNRTFHHKLMQAGMTQSMSRVAHCIDNGPMEGFWGILKWERYYGRRFTSKRELVQTIENYIHYYNTRRVQRNLGVLTPMEKHELALSA